MIKLNNKNITYVALADSSNSLKAPKEIWYADSNNSVKLVYRRKDALIEGEDYEKYHWLGGDGNSYLDVKGFSRNENWEIVTKLRQRNINTWVFLYGVGMIGNSYNDGVWTAFGGTVADRVAVRVSNGTTHKDYFLYDITENQEIQVIDNHSSVVFNGNVISVTGTPNRTYKQCNEFYIFSQYYTNRDTPLRIADADFSDFIVNESGINILNLIPCKLLKPVPKWLDANGIRRQVGECGMIDLVSGKFYGNVNSVGTFTVENYYERKEWLQGRNGAYINTMHPLTTYDDAFYVKAHFDGTIKNPNNEEQNIFGYTHLNNNTITDICRLYINSSGRISCNYYVPDGNWSPIPDSTGITNIEVYSSAIGSNHYVNLNGSNYVKSTNGLQEQTFGSFIALFSNNGDDDNGERLSSRYFHGDIASFRISDHTFTTDKMNLIPCILTMDLPASMDANNIARTKGTSGMWDLVSDRFYGNVANSGTFKAVNLAEGVDYEVYDWLRGDGTAYIEGIQYNLWDNHIVLRVGKIQNPRSIMHYSGGTDKGRLHIIVNTDTGQSEPYLMVTFRELDLPAVHIADIRPFSSMPDIVDMDFYISNSTFYCEQNGVIKTNNPSQTAIESSWSSITPKIQSSKMSYIREVLPNDTYRSNLIPVKLLRSIPSKYDANGIARQAGECGMYDTVNDVFYGNVASSGSFTVEDDN